MQDLVAQYAHDHALCLFGGPTGIGRAVKTPSPAEFATMVDAFSRTGGLLGADELAGRIAPAVSNGVGMVARWIVERHAVSLHWQGGYWLPAFQFTGPSMLLRASLGAVLDELAPVLDDWDIACWFAGSNLWLQNRTPASALAHSPCDVLDAARAYRFSICG